MYERLWNGTYLVGLISIVSVVIIAATYWDIVYSKGYQSASEEHSTYRAERDAQDRYYKKCLERETIYSARECITNTPNTDRDAQRSEQDLDAQRQMAQWAEGMLWATWVIGLATASVAAVGTCFLYETLRQTRQIGQAQVRAYISCTGATYTLRDRHFFLHCDLENFGQSPALNLSAKLHFKYYANPEFEENDLFLTKTKEMDRHLYAIQAGVKETVRFLVMDETAGIVSTDTLKDIILDSRMAHFVVNLSWEDVFLQKHELEIVMFHSRHSEVSEREARGSLYLRHQNSTHKKQKESA